MKERLRKGPNPREKMEEEVQKKRRKRRKRRKKRRSRRVGQNVSWRIKH